MKSSLFISTLEKVPEKYNVHIIYFKFEFTSSVLDAGLNDYRVYDFFYFVDSSEH